MQFEESDTRGRSSDRVALTVPIALWAGPSQGIPRNPAQADAIRYPRGQLN